MQIEGPDGATLWQSILGDNAARGAAYVQVPLYPAPNEPFPPGRYRLQLVVDDAASASLAFEIR